MTESFSEQQARLLRFVGNLQHNLMDRAAIAALLARLETCHEHRTVLLAACKMVADMAVGWQPLTPGDITEVKAAIAKAEGIK